MMLAANIFHQRLGGYFCMLSKCLIWWTPHEEKDYQGLMLTYYYVNLSYGR